MAHSCGKGCRGAGAYYFEPAERADGPYERQMHVVAIVDVAQDGTLAGIEIIDPEMPLPFQKQTETQ